MTLHCKLTLTILNSVLTSSTTEATKAEEQEQVADFPGVTGATSKDGSSPDTKRDWEIFYVIKKIH